MKKTIYVISGIMFLLACMGNNTHQADENRAYAEDTLDYSNVDTATFAGGCFWCVEASFEQIRGVKAAVSGFAGGQKKDPSYDEVAAGKTDYAETVQLYYDPKEIGYRTLLDIFFTAHDPTQLNRQGPDIGKQYRSALFYHNHRQLRLAEAAIDSLNNAGVYEKKIVTQLKPYKDFYPASDYHQNYEEKQPDDPYIQNVSRPKINKVKNKFEHLLKEGK